MAPEIEDPEEPGWGQLEVSALGGANWRWVHWGWGQLEVGALEVGRGVHPNWLEVGASMYQLAGQPRRLEVVVMTLYLMPVALSCSRV